MAEHVETYQYFLSQRLVGGCIALMQKITVSGKSSPFSYEYGYLCVRIILFSLGTYLIYRSEKYRNMQRDMVQSPDIEFPLLFSRHVGQVVEKEFGAAAQGLECDSILGWGSSNDPPVASREQVRVLVEILWEDRANFLKLSTLVYSPGLSGLSFLLWRYIYLDALQDLDAKPDFALTKRITEIHFRCMLAATSEHSSPMLGIADELYDLLGSTPGQDKIIFSKSEDAQMIFEAYIARLGHLDTQLYSLPHISLVTLVLELVVANMRPGLEGLLPTIFERTIQRFWKALVYHEESKTLLIGTTGLMLEHFKSLLQPSSRTSVFGPPSQKAILQSFAKNDLLDFVGSILFRLDPDAHESNSDYSVNHNLLKTIQTIFDKVGACHTPVILDETFRDYAPDWLKVRHHLFVRAVCMDPHNDPSEAAKIRKRHYDRCLGVWGSITQNLRQYDNIEEIRASWNGCSFVRCQDPIGLDRRGAPYTCSRCSAALYCSIQCQAGD